MIRIEIAEELAPETNGERGTVRWELGINRGRPSTFSCTVPQNDANRNSSEQTMKYLKNIEHYKACGLAWVEDFAHLTNDI